MGFSLVGVTTPEPLPHAQVFEAWLEQGRHGEMSYLATSRSKECRAYPGRILPECRSVLVLGMGYPANRPEEQRSSELVGKVAAYAWGEDYHDTFARRLPELVRFIEGRVGQPVENRWYSDTGPLLEGELAQRAGLGWIGTNTCLINPNKGSYILLGEILLGIDLAPDQPYAIDRCGNCQRCIEACPTGCILPDRTLDARRCISYLTIELKGMIAAELRPLMGSWVFGCDICQQVCPWNRFAPIKGDQAYGPSIIGPTVALLDEITLSEQDFRRKYRHSPIWRAKRRGYLRNLAVALGNSGNLEAIPALEQALVGDPEPLVRAHTAWALGEIGGAGARRSLELAVKAESEPLVRQEIDAALKSVNL